MSDTLDHEIRTLQALYGSERDPDGLAFAPLADAFLKKGDVREALDLLNSGTARHPDFSTGHVIAARLYFDQGLHAEAELAARRVLELDAENLVALSILGAMLEERGDTEEAAGLASVLVGLDPDSDEARAVTDRAEVTGSGVVQPPPLPGEGGAASDAPFAHQELDISEAPTVELMAIAPDSERESSFEDALSLGSPDAGEPDEEDGELAAALGALGLADSELETAADVVDALGDEPDLPFMDLGALAPDPEPELEAMDLGALAPDPEPELEAMDLGALAPDPEPELEAMDLGALAPDPEPELEVMDLGALAPDPEPELEAMDLGALAPDPEPELEVMDLGALAPDAEPEVEAMDLGALAPDPEPELEVMDLGALAPDPEPELEVMDLGALAPDPEPELEVMDLGALAPDPEPELETMDLSALAPDPEPELEVMDLGALAPDPEPEPDVMDLGALAPDPEPEMEAIDLAALAPADPSEKDPHVESNEAVYTRTLAELYVKQGFIGQALDVLRHLHAEDPDSEELKQRIAELEQPGAGSAPAEEEVETLARDLAEIGDAEHEVDTPFAWPEGEARAAKRPSEGSSIGGYFDGLLSWDTKPE